MLFVGLVRLLEGPARGDSLESSFSIWALAHGDVSCAYPPGDTSGFPFIAPLYPLISGGVDSLVRIGHQIPFPSQAALGSNCSQAIAEMTKWSIRSGATASTVHLGYLGWLVLMGGLIALLRAAGRGRCGWEPIALIFVACVPPVFMCVQSEFHPQDLMAVGLALGGVACLERRNWVLAGILLGAAITSQQFALLIFAPLVVIVPRRHRIKFVGSATGIAVAICLPLIALSAGRAIYPIVLGSGNGSQNGGTVLSALHVHGPLLIAASRVLPVVLSMLLAKWAIRKLGLRLFDPVPLISLLATSLSLRLVFEQNLYGYYFMAVAVLLVLIDVVRGHVSGYVVGWLGLVWLVFDPLPWRDYSLSQFNPIWIWHVILIPPTVALAIRPLLGYVRDRVEPARVRPVED